MRIVLVSRYPSGPNTIMYTILVQYYSINKSPVLTSYIVRTVSLRFILHVRVLQYVYVGGLSYVAHSVRAALLLCAA